jgi:hypothetical protein
VATSTRNGRKNGKTKPAPDLLGALAKKPGRPKKTRTADQIADSIEKEAKRLQGVADILRGTT